MSEILQALNCPQCGGSPLTDNGDGTLSCSYCSSAFAHPDRVCPRCETVNEVEALACTGCGEKLKEACPRCGTFNWLQAPHCRQCGAALDLLEHIAARHAETTANRIVRQQSEMNALKAEAERASQARLQAMWARDNARLEAMDRDQARQQRQERLLWIIATTAVVLLLLCVLVASLLAPWLRMRNWTLRPCRWRR